MLFVNVPAVGRMSLLAAALRPQDVFATSLYTGTGAAQTITNGLNLAGQGGLTWTKARGAGYHTLWDTARGAAKAISSNVTDAEAASGAGGLQSFLSNGFTLGSNWNGENNSGSPAAAWSFRRAAKFFAPDVFTHTSGVADNINLSSLGTIGMIVVKSRSTGSWYVWHRSLTAGDNLRLNTTAASSAGGLITVSGTSLIFDAAAGTDNYVYYAWAHDPDTTNGIIQCGSFTTDASGNASVTVGWQPQWLLTKASGAVSDWIIHDTARGWGAGADAFLKPNLSAAEASADLGAPNATGFTVAQYAASTAQTYCAIRAPVP
jgi:hypothetical protein